MADASPPGPRPRLDARTIGICVCIALLFALGAGLVTKIVLDDDSASGSKANREMKITEGKIDVSKLLAVDLETPDGKATNLGRSLSDKPVLVNLWQQSCVPCVDEMPLLEQFHTTDDRVEVIGVDTQDRVDLARQMVEQTGITYPWVQDPEGNFFYRAKATGLPATLLLAPDGKVLDTKAGAFKSLDELTSWVDRALG